MPHARPRYLNLKQYPPPFPDGWYYLCNSTEVPSGVVRKFELAGNTVVAYREKLEARKGIASTFFHPMEKRKHLPVTSTQALKAASITQPHSTSEGQIFVMDAYCPHMGADLSSGTPRVEKDCIVCPFHGWKFRGSDGECIDIPYSTAPTLRAARLKSWHVVEQRGMVIVWLDSRAPDSSQGHAPVWALQDDGANGAKVLPIDDLEYFGQTDDIVHTHIQDILENGPDVQHFAPIHKTLFLHPWLSFLQHNWTVEWTLDPDIAHMTCIKLNQELRVCGFRIPGLDVPGIARQVGPGITVINLDLPLGKMVAYEFITPVQPRVQRATHQFFFGKGVPCWLRTIIKLALVNQFRRDISIWTNKVHLKQPLLVKGDGPIGQYRRWFSQFYSEHSESFETAMLRVNGQHIDW